MRFSILENPVGEKAHKITDNQSIATLTLQASQHCLVTWSIESQHTCRWITVRHAPLTPLSSPGEGDACNKSLLTSIVNKGCGLWAIDAKVYEADNMVPPLRKSLAYASLSGEGLWTHLAVSVYVAD